MQRRQTEAIAEFEKDYRSAQAAANAATGKSASSSGGSAPAENPPTGPATPATPTMQNQPQPTDGTNGNGETGMGTEANLQGGQAPNLADSATINATDAASNMAAAAAAATSTPAEARLELEAGLSDGESDITGTLSDGERDQMEIDAMVARIPKAQREGVRAMLEKSRIRRARRMQRHKKPETEAAGPPKNPKK